MQGKKSCSVDSDSVINNKVVSNEFRRKHGREKRHINVKIIYKQIERI